MLFLALQDRLEEIAADIVAHGLALGDGVRQNGTRCLFQFQIGLQHLFDGFADFQAAEQLEIG